MAILAILLNTTHVNTNSSITTYGAHGVGHVHAGVGNKEADRGKKQARDMATATSTPTPSHPPRQHGLKAWLSALFRLSLGEWFIAIAVIMGGCCSNVVALELIVAGAAKSGHLVTLLQFLFVVLLTIPQNVYRPNNAFFPRLAPRHIPLYIYILYVVLFLGGALLNAYALGFHVSVPLLIVFRSGALVASMLLGYCVSKRKYTRGQVIAVLAVTVGIVMATFAQGSSKKKAAVEHHDEAEFGEWLIGVGLLVLALLASSSLGLLQERTYKKYGNHWREGLFYSHVLSIPTLLFFLPSIMKQVALFNASDPISIHSMTSSLLQTTMPGPVIPNAGSVQGMPSGSLAHLIQMVALVLHKALPPWILHATIPSLWAYLFINVITQYFCVSGVHRLTALTSSVTVNLILNLRKLASLLISVWLFGNPMAAYGWVGCGLVFAGTVLYSLSTSKKVATAVKEKKQDGKSSEVESEAESAISTGIEKKSAKQRKDK